jgi:hypothetical protein
MKAGWSGKLEQAQQETAEAASPPKARGAWHLPSLAILMGGFGVLMGFATFVLVQDESHKPEQESIWIFIIGLIAAALTSFVIELVRARVEEQEHKPLNVGRCLGLLILLGIFELFVTGADSLARFAFAGHQSLMLNGLFSVADTTKLPADYALSKGAEMCYFAGLWIVLGCATGWAASRALPHSPPVSSRRTLITSGISMLKGVVAVALLAFAYVCIARLAGTTYVLLFHSMDYNPKFALLLSSQTSTNPVFGVISAISIGLASAMESVAHLGKLGGLGVIGVLIATWLGLGALVANSDRVVKWRALHGILVLGFVGALLLIALGPFATNGLQFSQLMNIVFACACIWLAPVIVLSVLAPALRAPSHNPRVWGLLAFGVAVVLLIIIWGRLSIPAERILGYLAIALLIFTAVFFLRGASLREFWPLAALIVAAGTYEVAMALAKLTVLSTYKSFALLQSAPVEADSTHGSHLGYSTVAAWRKQQTIDARTADLVAGIESQWDTVDGKGVAESIVTNSKTIQDQRATLINARLDSLCADSGSAWLNALHADLKDICQRQREKLIAAPLVVDTASPPDTAPPSDLRHTRPHPGTELWPLIREIEESNEARLAAASRSGRTQFDPSSLIASPHAPSPPAPPIQSHLQTEAAAASADAETELDLLKQFRWLAPDNDAMAALANGSRAHLPEPDRDLSAQDTVALLNPSAQRSAEERGWLVLNIMARSTPPGPAAIAWADNPTLHAQWQSELRAGLSIDKVDELWSSPLSELAGFSRLASSSTPDDWKVDSAKEPTELLRAKRTLLALSFASAQLAMLRKEASRGGGFEPDQRSVRYLELALGACFAFWATAGLLAVSAKQTHAAE